LPPPTRTGPRKRWHSSTNPGSLAGHRLKRPGVDNLLGRPPDLGEVPGHGGLIVVGLPVDHGLVHASPVQMGADGPLEVVDERVHLLIRCRPVEVALLVLDVAVERCDRRIDQAGHLKRPPARAAERESALIEASRRPVIPVGPLPCSVSISDSGTCADRPRCVYPARARARRGGVESFGKRCHVILVGQLGPPDRWSRVGLRCFDRDQGQDSSITGRPAPERRTPSRRLSPIPRSAARSRTMRQRGGATSAVDGCDRVGPTRRGREGVEMGRGRTAKRLSVWRR
jgi:hypothetical protein